MNMFQVGDVVRLNSDVACKHLMTVESCDEEGGVGCVWHNRRGDSISSYFEDVMLTAVSKRRETKSVGRPKVAA